MGSIYKRGDVFWIKYYRHGNPYRKERKRGRKKEGTFVQNVPGDLQCCSNLASIMLSTLCTNVPLTVPLTKETNHSAAMNRLQDGSLIVRRKK